MEINKLLSDKRPDLSQLSIKTYASCILKILELTKSKDLNILYDEPKKIINILDENYKSPNTKKTKIASIVVFLKILDNEKEKNKINKAMEQYAGAIDKYSDEIKSNLSTNMKSKEEKDNWTNEKDVVDIKEKLFELIPKQIKTLNDYIKFRNYIIYIIYQEIPSRSDIADSKILYSSKKPLSDEFNYIILDKKHKTILYKMNNYKTSSTYGTKNIELNSALYNILDKYKKEVDKFNNENWFLLNDSGEKLTRNRLGVIYSKLAQNVGINKKLGISLNRHIHISNLIPIEKMKELSNKMGNSVGEQVAVYAKI
jgi:hypothetical protein